MISLRSACLADQHTVALVDGDDNDIIMEVHSHVTIRRSQSAGPMPRIDPITQQYSALSAYNLP